MLDRTPDNDGFRMSIHRHGRVFLGGETSKIAEGVKDGDEG